MNEKNWTPENLKKESERIKSDARLVEEGAEYVIDDGVENPRLDVDPESVNVVKENPELQEFQKKKEEVISRNHDRWLREASEKVEKCKRGDLQTNGMDAAAIYDLFGMKNEASEWRAKVGDGFCKPGNYNNGRSMNQALTAYKLAGATDKMKTVAQIFEKEGIYISAAEWYYEIGEDVKAKEIIDMHNVKIYYLKPDLWVKLVGRNEASKMAEEKIRKESEELKSSSLAGFADDLRDAGLEDVAKKAYLLEAEKIRNKSSRKSIELARFHSKAGQKEIAKDICLELKKKIEDGIEEFYIKGFSLTVNPKDVVELYEILGMEDQAKKAALRYAEYLEKKEFDSWHSAYIYNNLAQGCSPSLSIKKLRDLNV